MSKLLPNATPIPQNGPGANPDPYPFGSTSPNLGLPLAPMGRAIADALGVLDTLFAGAGAGAAIPVIQSALQAVNTNTLQSISFVAPAGAASFYEVPAYINSRGDGAGGSSATLTLTWTGVSGVVHSVVLTVDGTVNGQVQLETIPFLVLGGSTVSITTAFTSTAFHYDVAARITVLAQ